MFKQHVPNYVDVTPKVSDASTLEEVLSIPWVYRWTEEVMDAILLQLCQK